jgi:hypothetical protein
VRRVCLFSSERRRIRDERVENLYDYLWEQGERFRLECGYDPWTRMGCDAGLLDVCKADGHGAGD